MEKNIYITNQTFFRERSTKPKSRTLEVRVKILNTKMHIKVLSFKSLLLNNVNNFRGSQLKQC